MKIKNIIVCTCFSVLFSFMFLTFSSINTKAYSREYCTINGIDYDLPFSIATTSYTTMPARSSDLEISEIYERVHEENVKVHYINMDMDCSNFYAKFVKNKNNIENTYTINNMVLDTYEAPYWSYSNRSIYEEKSTATFKGVYTLERYYKFQVQDSTNYTIKINGNDYTSNDIIQFNYEEIPLLTLEFYNEYGQNVSGEVTLENCIFEYIKGLNQFQINPYSNLEDIFITSKIKEKEITSFTLISFYNDPRYLQDIINTLKIEDNIDGDVKNSLTITKDEYSSYETTVGTYQIDFYVSDTNNNKSYGSITIYVVDKVAPIINGPDVVYNNLSDIQSIESIIARKFSIYDEHDGNVDDKLLINSDGYNPSLPGDYQITLTVSDGSNNITTRTFIITVVDDIPPVITIDNSFYIYTSASEYIGIDQMVYVFTRDQLINASFDSFEICEDTYSASHDKEGTYKVLLMFNYGDDIEYKEINVVVEKDKVQNKSSSSVSYLWFIIPFLFILFIIFKINKAILN